MNTSYTSPIMLSEFNEILVSFIICRLLTLLEPNKIKVCDKRENYPFVCFKNNNIELNFFFDNRKYRNRKKYKYI